MDFIKDKKGNTIEIKSSWCFQDVFEQARNNGIKLTRKEVGDVLDYIGNEHDACIGINWEVIDHYIDEVVSERKENVKTKK